jgi:hypothetical protein
LIDILAVKTKSEEQTTALAPSLDTGCTIRTADRLHIEEEEERLYHKGQQSSRELLVLTI